MKKTYKHPSGYEIVYDPKKFTVGPTGTVFLNTIPELLPENIEKAKEKARIEAEKKESKRIEELKKLAGKRVLCYTEKESFGYYHSGTFSKVTEKIFLEISPSGDYAKTMDMHGVKLWEDLAKIHVKEILGDYAKYARAKKKLETTKPKK